MRKTYQIPSVILAQLMPSTIVLAGSAKGLGINSTPIDNEGGD